MVIEALAEVSRIEKNHEYALNEDGSKNWDKKVEYFETTLTIMDNSKGTEGSVTVRGRLAFGQIYKISVDLSHPTQIIETRGDIALPNGQNTVKSWP
jgi:hypothetical protein